MWFKAHRTICLERRNNIVIVQDIIKILSTYEPETEVKMTSGPFISEIVDVRPVTDIDTNKTYMCIYGDKDVFTKYENMGLLQ